MKGLEEVYYGKILSVEEDTEDLENTLFQCPICSGNFDSNISLQKDIMAHVISDKDDNKFQCIYCLEKHSSDELLKKHCLHQHPIKTKNPIALSYSCLICQVINFVVGYCETYINNSFCLGSF